MAADDERPGPAADSRTLALSDGVFAIAVTPGQHWWTVPAILLLAIPLWLLVGGWALLLRLLLPLARRA